MDNAQKVVLTNTNGAIRMQPFETEQRGGSMPQPPLDPIIEPKPLKGNRIRDYANEQRRRFGRILAKLAKINGYDDKFQMKLANGNYLANSDVISLVLYAISPGKALQGLREFAGLLQEAKVDPEIITNENLKALMRNSSLPTESHLRNTITQPTVTSQTSRDEPQMHEPRLAHKRKRDEGSETPIHEPIIAHKRKRNEESPPPLNPWNADPIQNYAVNQKPPKISRWEHSDDDDG